MTDAEQRMKREDGDRRDERPRVVIVGFMCAGKTTLARELASRLGCEWADLDERVRARERRTPQQLIEEVGEPAFRDAETRALAALLEEDGDVRVVAAGGGTWALERNRSLMAEHGCISVWLDAPFELCRRRIEREGGAASRPLARDAAAARRLYDERLALYRLADLRVSAAEGRTPAALAEEVLEALQSSAR